MRGMTRPVLAGMLVGASVTATAAGPGLLGRVSTGEWQLQDSGSGAVVQRLCVTSPSQLVQLRHGDAGCSRVVLDDSARSTTVRYTCPGGAGRTTLTLNGTDSMRIQTQGLAGGEPFDVDYQARLIGRCG